MTATIYPLSFAPLQGYTDDVYRRVHHEVWGGVDCYYTPFMRLEHGGVRSKDLRDANPANNQGVDVVPQLIARDGAEAAQLIDTLAGMGYRRMDVNMGCPFPLQTRHGRGAGLLPHADKMDEIARVMAAHADVTFSAKMRLGLTDADEWRAVIDVVNAMPLCHLTVHPRVAAQQYKGEVSLEAFEQLLAVSRHKVVYNGDLRSLTDIDTLAARFGQRISGIMMGRGLLARPWLAAEYASGQPLSPAERRCRLLRMHALMADHYARIIPGEAQRMQKLRTMWDYMEPTLGRKQWKRLMKAGSWRNYMTAVEGITIEAEG